MVASSLVASLLGGEVTGNRTCMAGNKIQGVIKKSTTHELSVSTGKSINCSYKVLLFVFSKKPSSQHFHLPLKFQLLK